MSTRLYKINGEYNTFEYWHDHYGYTKTPTFSIQYKTTNPWGAAFASGGYYDAEDLMDIFTFSFFVPGVVGWNGIDDLALVGYYPAAATDLTVARDSEVSNAATLTQDNETYYLVQNDIEYGWMSQAEFEARGWSTDVGDPPSYIVFDTSTGTIVHSIVDEGLVYGEVGYVLMDEAVQMITVYETGVRTESFYFTTNGRNETQNTNISHADIPVYLEDGTTPAADTPYNGSSVLAFMDVTGNTKQADGESLYVDNGVLRLDAPDTDEGEQWAALVERIFTLSFANTQLPGITITLPASETGTSGTTVTLPTMSGEYESGGKTWSPTAWDIGAFGSTYTITSDTVAHLIFEEVPSELTAYFTNQGAAATGDTKIGGDFGWDSASLYDASGSPLVFDLTKKYTVLGMYNYSGASVETSSGSRIKDTNGLVQYIPSGTKRVFTIVLSLSPQTTIDAYFTSLGANETSNTWCDNSVTKTLYDSHGVPIPYDSTKTYTTVATFVVNGDTASTDFTGNYADWSDTILKGRPNGNKDCYKVVIRVE